jgi:hypothetical protein
MHVPFLPMGAMTGSGNLPVLTVQSLDACVCGGTTATVAPVQSLLWLQQCKGCTMRC